MKKVLLLIIFVFLIQYESHYWYPCSGSTCYAVHCSDIRGCFVEGDSVFCADEACVTDLLEKRGTEHLGGIWKIDPETKSVKEYKPVKKYQVEIVGKDSSGTMIWRSK